MTKKLEQTIKEEIIQLPKEIQEAIYLVDWVNITKEVGEKYLLEEEEIDDLQLETLLVLTGFTNPESYIINVENQVNTSKETAEKIGKEIFQKVFNPINNLVIENIKKRIKDIKADWKQNINFILSGGNYSAFIERSDDTINTTPNIPLVRGNTTSPLLDKGEVGRGF